MSATATKNRNAGRPWTQKDDDYLRHWHGKTGISLWNMAMDLGRSEEACRQRAKKLGIGA